MMLEVRVPQNREHERHGWLLAVTDRKDQAIASGKQGVELEPVSPEANMFLGMHLYMDRQYGPAIQQLRSTIDLAPMTGSLTCGWDCHTNTAVIFSTR
jgi:hypothetical protein